MQSVEKSLDEADESANRGGPNRDPFWSHLLIAGSGLADCRGGQFNSILYSAKQTIIKAQRAEAATMSGDNKPATNKQNEVTSSPSRESRVATHKNGRSLLCQRKATRQTEKEFSGANRDKGPRRCPGMAAANWRHTILHA